MLLDGGIDPVGISIIRAGCGWFVGWGGCGWWLWCGDICQVLVCGSHKRDEVGESGNKVTDGGDECVHIGEG